MARPIFDEELHQLRSDVIEMAEFAKEAIEGSFDAVRQVSATKAYLVASNDSLIDGKEREIESLCLRLLLCAYAFFFANSQLPPIFVRLLPL